MEDVLASSLSRDPPIDDGNNKVHVPHNVLLVGPRRAGKSSLCKVVYESYQPNDTLFLAPTMRTQKLDANTFQNIQLWDVPGSALMSFSSSDQHHPPPIFATPNMDFAWAEVNAIIFVLDAQDDYFEALSKLNQVIVHAYTHNKSVHFHVFINKADGLSEDYRYDTQRDIEQRVTEGLIDSSHEFSGPNDEHVQLDQQVTLKFHLTSVFDTSVFIAFSRIQHQLMQGPQENQELESMDSASAVTAMPSSPGKMLPPKPPRMVSLMEALETACNLLCTSCYFEKAYIFDVPSCTFVGCDTSPFDLALFDVMFQYIQFLRQFSDLYSHLRDIDSMVEKKDEYTRVWSSSIVRLGNDTTVAFWQLDRYVFLCAYISHLALLAVIQSDIQSTNTSILVRISRPSHTLGLQCGLVPHDDSRVAPISTSVVVSIVTWHVVYALSSLRQ